MDGMETIIRNFFVLVRHYKRCPKEVNNCSDVQKVEIWKIASYRVTCRNTMD